MEMMTGEEKSRAVKRLAAKLGFEACGVTRAEAIGRGDYLREWLAAGRAGSMEYLHRHVDVRVNPQALLPAAKSVIVCAQVYHQPAPSSAEKAAGAGTHSESQQHSDGSPDNAEARGRVAMYAWGRDYHKVLRRKLWRLVDNLRAVVAEPFEGRVCVDTAPVLERELAAAAGIGWIGKNTLVLNSQLGSYFFLGAVVTTLELPTDAPGVDHCGTCRACLDACPTQAFPKPYEMDATRCISYLTIEHRDDIPEPLRQPIGDWLFGCDICQEVCPFNRHAPATTEPDFAPRSPAEGLPLAEVLSWTVEDYRAQLAGSAMKRATAAMLKRNAQIVQTNMNTSRSGNQRNP